VLDDKLLNTVFLIHNSLGQLVFSGNTKTELDLSNYKTGIYHISFYTDGLSIYQEKIILHPAQ